MAWSLETAPIHVLVYVGAYAVLSKRYDVETMALIGYELPLLFSIFSLILTRPLALAMTGSQQHGLLSLYHIGKKLTFIFALLVFGSFMVWWPLLLSPWSLALRLWTAAMVALYVTQGASFLLFRPRFFLQRAWVLRQHPPALRTKREIAHLLRLLHWSTLVLCVTVVEISPLHFVLLHITLATLGSVLNDYLFFVYLRMIRGHVTVDPPKPQKDNVPRWHSLLTLVRQLPQSGHDFLMSQGVRSISFLLPVVTVQLEQQIALLTTLQYALVHVVIRPLVSLGTRRLESLLASPTKQTSPDPWRMQRQFLGWLVPRMIVALLVVVLLVPLVQGLVLSTLVGDVFMAYDTTFQRAIYSLVLLVPFEIYYNLLEHYYTVYAKKQRHFRFDVITTLVYPAILYQSYISWQLPGLVLAALWPILWRTFFYLF